MTINQANMTSSAVGVITDATGSIAVWNMGFINGETSIYTGTGPSLICTSSGCTVTDGAFSPTIGVGETERSGDMDRVVTDCYDTGSPGSITELQSTLRNSKQPPGKTEGGGGRWAGQRGLLRFERLHCRGSRAIRQETHGRTSDQLIAIATQVKVAEGCS